MKANKKNQESITSPQPNHYGSPVAREAVKPTVRLYDTGNHTYVVPEGCGDEPLFSALGAMVAVDMAAKEKPHVEATDRGAVLLISPHDTQRQLHEAMIADLQLNVSTPALKEPCRQQSEIVVLDLITQTTLAGTQDDWRIFRHDQGFLKAAFSAARRETILLGDSFELLEGLPADAALRRKIDALQRTGSAFEPFPEAKFRPAANLDCLGIGFYLDWDEAHEQIHEDVAAAKTRVIWNLPGLVGGDRMLIQRRPRLDQVLVQRQEPATVRRWEDLGFRVSTELRGEHCILVDDDLLWLIGSPRIDDDIVRPFARVRGRRTASLLADLFKLREFFEPTPLR